MGPCILILHRLELFVHNVHLSIADSENMAFYTSRARSLSFDFKKLTVVGVHKTDAAAMHLGVRHGIKVNEHPKLIIFAKLCEVHCASDFFGLKETADFPPHILRPYANVINLVGRAIHRDAHFGDVRINVFFRFSGASRVGFDKKQKNGLEQPALRVGLDVETAVGVLCQGHHLFSHDVVKGEQLAAVVHACGLVGQCLPVKGLIFRLNVCQHVNELWCV